MRRPFKLINASEKELNGSSQGLYINPIRGVNYYNPLNYKILLSAYL